MDDARRRAAATLADGSAFARFSSMVAAQGGDVRALEDLARLPRARLVRELKSPAAGIVAGLDARNIGRAAVLLGAGRDHKEDAIDPAVGLTLLKSVGDRIAAGEPWALVHANDETRLAAAGPLLSAALTLSDSPPFADDLVRLVLP